MPTEAQIPGVLEAVRARLAEAAKTGVRLKVSGEQLEDDWLYVVVTPDQPGAQAEFASIMSNQPNVAVPDELPTSFHVALNAGQDRDTARARYLTLPGVEEIILVAPH